MQVYEFLLANWSRLRFSPAVADSGEAERRINPKRMQREIKKQLQNTGIGTKAQQALKLQQQESKQARKTRLREKREEQKQQFELHEQKRKQKHRGH